MLTLKNKIITRGNKVITVGNKVATGCGSGRCVPVPGVNVATVDAFSSTVALFAGGASLSAGNYEVRYLAGALDFSNGFWEVAVFDGFVAFRMMGVHVKSAGVDIGRIPSIEDGGFTTQAACEAANAGFYLGFAHPGGTIGVFLDDSVYGDNVSGSPNPTYLLCQVQ